MNPLHRLIVLRRVEVLAQALVLILAVFWLRIPLAVAPMAAVIAVLAAANLATQWRLGRSGPVTDGELFAQLSVDVAALTLLLYQAGGSANPFVSLFLLPPTLAAAMLPARFAWAMASLTLAAYTFLMFWNLPLPPAQGELAQLDALLARATGVAPEHSGHMSGFALHVLGMWLNFVISVGVVVFFLSRMAGALKQRERELATAREAALRHEQILALGTLAAGAAHKLGTPLATMAVVLRELELARPDDAGLQEDLALLRSQVQHCKQTISQTLASAGQARSESLQVLPLDSYLKGVLEDWQLIRPRARVKASLEGPQPAPAIEAERTLAQALISLLDNAADAGCDVSAPVEFVARWDAEECRIDILDHGSGISAETAERLGQAFFSTKQARAAGAERGGASAEAAAGGLGIGFFLTNATLERLGGKVEIFNREESGNGACTRVTLPLTRLRIAP